MCQQEDATTHPQAIFHLNKKPGCEDSEPDIDSSDQSTTSASSSVESELESVNGTTSDIKEQGSSESFQALRLNYLLVILAIMLADGLQGKKQKPV